MNSRFQDQNKTLSDFQTETLVYCPSCEKKAVAKVDYPTKNARLFCTNCGYNKELSTRISISGNTASLQIAAHRYFNARLWLQHSFKEDLFWAYNYAHLDYLEQYISAKLREHHDRTHFTLLEKLPKFYHEAKNREPLLKIIQKLKIK
ncbi:hypothetical protein [Flavobacterium cerinum]|uniref:TFIIB-type zinc ribbon-containing protein n=1 Tax=Flavobacterium cerinum TaxID=2502784 RepID=A0ABY5IPM9_9FLAO|nr:hypothetical protein [Flavobacterium cerinum]UUC44798.1 hypothetical protein NOX80_14320 [Flavobacterium cerinum]